MALGLKGEVRKQRWLYLVGQTRIHVDQVEGLGSYMELEVGTWCTPELGEETAAWVWFLHRNLWN